ncbi:MAG: histidine phosphatase family protein [Chloroflexia bacterium]
MRYLEVRRHTMRTKPGEHLSQAGVDLARRVGEGMGHFERVVSTLAPRAFETAIAMGFAVDEQSGMFPQQDDEVEGEVAWDAGYAAWGRAVGLGGAAAQFAQQEAACWLKIVEAVPEGGSALLVSHGGIIEAGAAGCMLTGEHTTTEASCDYCEGVRLSFDGSDWVGIRVLRVDYVAA